MNRLLDVQSLKTYFRTPGGVVPAVGGVSFQIDAGETLGVVGESGCGKSVTALSIMRLLQTPPARYEEGQVLYEGSDLLAKTEREMQQIRGNDIAMVFQEPMTSLDPVFTVGSQIAEAVRRHQSLPVRQSWETAVRMLKLVGVPDPERRAHEYPHQMSGGMRQRAMIAMALSCNPRLLIADEPTTALDVTIQAQILALLRRLKDEFGMAIMLITHDLGVVAEMAQRVVVMYAGKIVEEAPVRELFRSPLHPYTRGLLTCIPRLEGSRGVLAVIKGTVADPRNFPPGCRFHPRCSLATSLCREAEPLLVNEGPRRVACFAATGPELPVREAV